MKILRAKKSEFTKIALHLKCFFSKLYEYSLKIVMILETDFNLYKETSPLVYFRGKANGME